MNWYLKCLSNYANFKGRARRKEYWYFYLFWLIFSYLAEGIDYILFGYNSYADWDIYTEPSGFPIFSMIFIFGTLVPMLAVSWRRMHDIGKNGWYNFIPIYGWPILMCRNGDSGENDYGSDPKISSE